MPDVGIEPAAEADLTERRKLLMAILDAVYVDTVEEKSVVAIRPKPAFRPIFEVATTREGSGILLINETPPDPGRQNHCVPGGDGLESTRSATNLPLGSVGSNQVYRMVKKSGLGVKNLGADLMGAIGWSRVEL